jgi:hypothetical protein
MYGVNGVSVASIYDTLILCLHCAAATLRQLAQEVVSQQGTNFWQSVVQKKWQSVVQRS